MLKYGVVALVCALALAGCGGEAEATDPAKLDDAGNLACQDFAEGYPSAVTQDARVALANKVAKWAPKSQTNRIADMSQALGRAADGSPGAWKIAADAFAQACLDAGYKSR
ncbi:hypothetical protein AB0K34_11060 [Actinomadura sp. NPDC049382]|uniref:hypothetical protein n=1 Tax=Actinomadura sp. NPDC049382 TaxID=3158220 RepID=UPI003417E39D